MTENGVDMLAIATAYAARGWLVFPIHSPRAGAVRCSCGDGECSQVAKHPRTAHGFLDATADAEVIAAWWARWPRSNIGIATGAGTGFVVIDVDVRHGGHETLSDLLDEHGQFEPTIETYTGGGGRHILFRHPGVRIRNNAGGKLGRGLDVRGDGGYIVAPGSLHADGRRYEWRPEFGPDDREPSAMPAWLIALLREPDRSAHRNRKATTTDRTSTPADAGRYWLQKAIDRCTPTTRNDTGWWLACQLRDSGITRADAESLLIEFVGYTPASDHPYTEKEARASIGSAFNTGPREPARSANGNGHAARRLIIGSRTLSVSVPAALAKPESASKELRAFYQAVADGRVYNVPLPWPIMTRMTQSLLPGSIMMLCGEPGVGKTFWTLQELLFWHANGIAADVFFIEKDRLFHTRRLLALLEGDGRLTLIDYVRQHPEAVESAMARHAGLIDELGDRIHSRPGGRISLDDLLTWMRDRCKCGTRVMVIDPITAAFAGAERWLADDDFVTGAQRIVSEFGASLKLVTHPRKGNISGRKSTGHDMGGGAAFHRFVDTVVWLQATSRKGKSYSVQTAHGPMSSTPDVIAHLLKTRDGTGANLQIAMKFGGNALHFREEGVIEKEMADSSEAA